MLDLQDLRRGQNPEDGWEYQLADTKQVTHGIHAYPAMMIPQIARRLLQTYGCKGDLLFDPYCGSGTTLLEGMLAEVKAVGTDLNPLARLIARVKTTPIRIASLDREILRLPSKATSLSPCISNIPNVDYWFSRETQRDLSILKEHIDCILESSLADVLRVAFSITVRKVSWTRQTEFKLYRIPHDKLANHNPDSFRVMRESSTCVRNALLDLNKKAHRSDLPTIHDFNSVVGIPQTALSPNSVDLVITSPPYGDSKTTVAYGQFCRLSSQWLGFSDANQVDNMLMGGRKIVHKPRFGIRRLDETIDDIAAIDKNRAREVASFFKDYRASIRNVASTVKKGGYSCYVVENRTVKGYVVPTAEATAAFFEENGFKMVAAYSRKIPNKRMPYVNSPSNVAGRVGKTMTTEKIVICRKAV